MKQIEIPPKRFSQLEVLPYSLLGNTLVLEAVSVICRYYAAQIVLRIVFVVLSIFYIFSNSSTNLDRAQSISDSIDGLSWMIALTPYVWSWLSFAALVLFDRPLLILDSTWTNKVLDARELSPRERSVVAEAMQTFPEQLAKEMREHLKARGDDLHIYAVDNLNEINAFTIGGSVYVTTGLLKSPYIAPLIAHELGHLVSFDGHIQLALRRLVLYPAARIWRSLWESVPGMTMRLHGAAFFGGAFLFLLALGGGGVGLFLTQSWWNKFWREQEYAADQFAKRCGQAENLIRYLEVYQIHDVAVPFQRTDKPHNEERITKLLDEEEE